MAPPHPDLAADRNAGSSPSQAHPTHPPALSEVGGVSPGGAAGSVRKRRVAQTNRGERHRPTLFTDVGLRHRIDGALAAPRGVPLRVVPTRANGQPAFGIYLDAVNWAD